MVIKLSKLAETLNSSVEELVTLLKEHGFEFDEKTLSVEDDIAELLEDELGTTKSDIEKFVDNVEENLERETKKTQRKQVAGQKKVNKFKSQDSDSLKVDTLVIGETISVKELSEKTGINAAKLIGELMKNGILANINQQLDFETVSLVCSDFGIAIKKQEKSSSTSDLISQNLKAIIGEDDKEDLKVRPPIITIMGHVDHGKTKLLDTIRKTNVVAKESGGITQHIAAYQVEKNGRLITFLDTPGHEAFTEMRSRGARLTDIAILVVSAVEGVKPTTIEAINHAQDAGVPIIVAINKMDLPGANPDKVKTELVEYGLQAEDWGGKTIMCPISALSGEGIDHLLEMILLVADIDPLLANPSRRAIATVVETHVEQGLGPVATIVVNTGTLKLQDNFVVGDAYGKVKTMLNDKDKQISSVSPGCPCVLAGLSKTPHAGDILQVVGSDKEARDMAVQIEAIRKSERLSGQSTLTEIVSKIRSGDLKVVKVIVKTDTKGSFDAIKQSIEKLKHEEVMIKIIHHGIGNISQTDVTMAAAGGAVILGFHVSVPPEIKKLSENRGVEIKNYKIIYEMINDLTNIMSGLLEPEEIINELGKAEIREVFFTKKAEQIIGLKITNGMLKNKSKLRVIRGGEQVGEGQILSLQKGQKPEDTVKSGNEAGIKYKGSVLLEANDIIEAYEIELRERTL